MRRTALLILLALGVGLALGAGAGGLKFSYLPPRWSRQVDITEMELACIEGLPTHVHLKVQVKLEGTERGTLQRSELDGACTVLVHYWRDKLVRKPIPRPPVCPVTIDLIHNSKTIYRLIHNRLGRRGYVNPKI
jgi:hypothetical protein